MDIEIADVSLRLLDKLWEIENQCFDQEAFTKQQLAYLIADYNTIGLTARVNGEIAGFAMARVNIRRTITFGHILTIDVPPVYRRKGIAQKLLQEIEATFRNHTQRKRHQRMPLRSPRKQHCRIKTLPKTRLQKNRQTRKILRHRPRLIPPKELTVTVPKRN